MRRAPLLAACLFAACASVGSDERAPAPDWTFAVRLADGGSELSGTATFAGGARTLVVGRDAAAFVRSLAVRRGDRWVAAERAGAGWAVPESVRPLVVRWSFDVAGAARALRDSQFGRQVGAAYLASPSTWLVRPAQAERGRTARLVVVESDRARFACGLFPSAPDGSYEFAAHRVDRLPYAVLGDFLAAEIPLADGRLEVAVLPGHRRIEDDELLDWIEQCARAVALYYGRFPTTAGLVVVEPRSRGGGGRTLGNQGAAILFGLSERASRAELDRDWVLIHEMVHFACPLLAREHHWLEEGLSTYVEPIARVRAGLLSAEEFWTDTVEMMPYGLPRSDDRGLDRTRTWGRVYWGGALFCLLADLEIRDRTENRQGLEHALRAVLASGLDIRSVSSMEELLTRADQALEVGVLADLWRRMRHDPYPVDLNALWARLGIRSHPGGLLFDDAAPWASLRRAIAGPAPAE